MKAVLFRSKDEPLWLGDVPRPVPGKGELLVQLKYAALNHLDLWIWKEQVLEKPVIPGSDGCGIVIMAGEDTDPDMVGQEVIINPALYWGDDLMKYDDRFEILGNPTNGTFAQMIVIPREYVYPAPKHLSAMEAAALPMAALTAYRILFSKAKLHPSDKILITGIGGGVALFLLQMSIAAGAQVYVTSSSEEKISKAVSLGAAGGFNYTETGWVQTAIRQAGTFDVIVDSAGGPGFNQLAEVAAQDARIVSFGRTAGPITQLNPGLIYNKQLHIMGSVMGNQQEFRSMLSFYEQHRLRPVIDKTFALEEIDSAATYMRSSTQFGKVIIRV